MFYHCLRRHANTRSFVLNTKSFSSSFFHLSIMSSIVTAVFKATIGLLVNKGRDKVAEKLKDGDVTDQKFRGLIIREIDDIKSKLDGLSRKDLLASISFFEEGIEFLYEVFDKARSRNEYSAVTTQAACAEAFSLAEGMRTLELTNLDESATRALFNAKKRFKEARREATRAFKNESLETSDRILALQYRVMATILETVDNPADALAPCRVCIKELNSLSTVQNSFAVQLKKGIQAVRGLFGKEERGKIIASVCHVNRVIYDVTQTVGKDVCLWTWPAVDIGDREVREDKVDPLRDERVTEVLRKQGMEDCCVTWSFGQEGEEEQKLKDPCGIATNSSGQFIVGGYGDSNVKVFDSNGTFISLFSLPTAVVDTKVDVDDVAADVNDNIYVLVRLKKPGDSIFEGQPNVYKFNNTADLPHMFPVRGGYAVSLTVTDSGKVLVLNKASDVVDVYETDGQFVCEFGKGILTYTRDITAANDGRVMVVDKDCCVHIFSEHGDHLNKFKLKGCYSTRRIAFHPASQHVVVAGTDQEKKDLLKINVEIYTKDGEFTRSTQIFEKGIHLFFLGGMTVTTEGRIAVAFRYAGYAKVLVI
ncbi:uncharacterized protein LOC144663708 [Oculina patagonica]